MPRRTNSGGVSHHTAQKGRSRRRHGVGSYSRKNKARHAERYERVYLTGNYGGAS